MPNLPKWVYPLAALALIIILALSRTDVSDSPASSSQPAQQTQTADNTDVVWSHGHDGARANAEEHWQKHGAEFPEFHSAQDYERGALAFVTKPPAGTLTKERDSGDTLLYDPATNTFAVRDERGEPRTFFRPNNRRAYWDRQ